MKNYAIWAWRPTDYNPQGQKLEFMDIRYHVQNTPQQSDKQGNDMDYFTRDLRDWANEQIEQGNHEEIITSYLAFPEEFFKKRYFYLEYLPDTNFHDFHATLIESANKHGLIVLSDFAEAVFYPDGRSEPSLAIDVIHEAQAEEIQTKLSIYGKKLEDFLEKGSVARSKIQLDVFVNLILKDYFDKLGLTYKIKNGCVILPWYDSEISINVHTNFFGNKISIKHADIGVAPNKELISKVIENLSSAKEQLVDRLKNTIFLYNWLHLVEVLDIAEYRNNQFKDNQHLYNFIHMNLDLFFNTLKGCHSFYDLIDKIYKDKSLKIHQYIFFGFEKEFAKSLPSNLPIAGNIGRYLYLLKFIQHPELSAYFENYKNYQIFNTKFTSENEKQLIIEGLKWHEDILFN